MATVIDADGLVVGRLSTHVAKRLLKGEEITVVNADKAIITGERYAILDEFMARRARGSERKGPYYPKMPDRILRRAIRGMLPRKHSRGRNALHRLEVYIGIPANLAEAKPETIPGAKKLPQRFMQLGELSRILGAKI